MSTDPIEDSYESWIEHEWEGPEHMAAFMSLLRVHRLVVDRVHAVLARWNLSITEHACLVYLAMSEGERQTLGKIAERTMIGAGRCNYMINKLEEAGYLRRKPHPSDGRTTYAVLTAKGRRAVRAGIREVAAIGNGLGDLPLDQVEELRALLGAVLRSSVDAPEAAS
jgi:DNA-binding MarR family transcriptional regulator